ncbi:MAG TPA: isoprenylcysteine carboxylmethyltransferase family protein [Fimbriimonas sp.]
MIRRLSSRCRPHPSRTDRVVLNVAKTLLQIAVFWSFFLWLVPSLLVRIEKRMEMPTFAPQPIAGWILFASMGCLGLCSGMIFAFRGGGTPLPMDTTTRFLVLGPYRYVRNPMAIAGTMQGVAVGIVLGSSWVVVYAILGMLAWHLIARPWEEADLAERFGDPYLRYRSRVRCWIPRLSPYPTVCQPPLPQKEEAASGA